MKTFLGFVVALLFFHLKVQGQQFDQPVSLHFMEVPLEEVLEVLTERYGLEFSYANELIPLKDPVSIQVQQLPLKEFLDRLFLLTGLEYKVLGKYVALYKREKNDRPDQQKQDGGGGKLDSLEHVHAVLVIHDSLIWIEPRGILHLPADSVIPESVTMVQLPVFREDEAERKEYFWLQPLASLAFNHLYFDDSYETPHKIQSKRGYSFGIGCSKRIAGRMLADIQLRYRKQAFSVQYHFNVEPAQALGVPHATNVKLHYLTVPFSLFFRLLQYSYISCYGGFGLHGSWLLEEKETTLLDNGERLSGALYAGRLNSFLWGLRVPASVVLQLRDSLSLVFSPVYQWELNGFKEGNQRIRNHQLNVQLGVQIRL